MAIHPENRFWRTGVAIALFGLALIAAVWVMTRERIGYEHARVIQETTTDNENLTLKFEEQTIRTLKEIDRLLLFLQHEYRHHKPDRIRLDMQELVEEGWTDLGTFKTVAIVDDKGRIAIPLQNASGLVDVADRPYFLEHRDHARAGLLIGKPAAKVPAGEQPSVELTRRINQPDGSFGGVVLVEAPSEYFTSVYNKADFGNQGFAMLVHRDGVVVARRVGDEISAGQDMRESTLFKEVAKREKGSVVTVGRLDGVRRYMSYRTVRGFPLVAAIAAAPKEVLGEQQERQRVYLIAAALASVLIALFGSGLLFALRRQYHATAIAVKSEALYRATFEQAAVGIAHVSLEGDYLKVNAKLCELTGYSESELLGQSFAIVGHPQDLKLVNNMRERLLSGPSVEHVPEMEVRFIRKDGSLRWAVVAMALVRHPDGTPDYFLSMIQDAMARKLAQQQVVHQANHDNLTGLPNRILCQDRLAQALTRAKRNQSCVALLVAGLDRFQGVNDTLGHDAGDLMLKSAARRLTQCVRSGDTVARIGGDEFALVALDLSRAEDARVMARKIINGLEAPFDLNGNETFVTASVGIATFPVDGEDGEALLRNADTAMFRAKDQGRNNYQFYTATMNERALEKLQLENGLRRALERNEFLLHYQPKADLTSGSISGFEALLRWQHPERGLVSPMEFIPVLEDTGLIVPVGEWVLKTVCEQISSWKEQGIRPVPVSVNVSARQFREENLDAFIRCVDQTSVDPSLIKLELTESLLMKDVEATARILADLKAFGMQLSVDDFGTGYSSLAYLKRFPLDELKIDRAFIRDVTDNSDDAEITLAIINLAHSLKLSVVAEGVETKAQLDFLHMHGCDEIQGFYFARPMLAEECAHALRQDHRVSLLSTRDPLDKPTVLIVDDNEQDAQILQRALEPGGYRLLVAEHSQAAFDLLRRHRVDIVISDQNMPGMSGVQFLATVRKLYPRYIRILVSGSSGMAALTDAVNQAGIHKYLSKDWDAARFLAEVRQAHLAKGVPLKESA